MSGEGIAGGDTFVKQPPKRTSGRIRAGSYGLTHRTPVNSDGEERIECQGFDTAFTLGTVTLCSNAPAGPVVERRLFYQQMATALD